MGFTWYDPINLTSPKVTWTTRKKNIIWPKIFWDDIFLKTILRRQHMRSTWVNLKLTCKINDLYQLRLTCKIYDLNHKTMITHKKTNKNKTY